MKGIILAAGKGNIHLSPEKSLPKCLINYDENTTVLDKIISSLNENKIENLYLVGGFEIEKIMSKYPGIRYFYNEKWEETKSLYSLLKASLEFDDDLIITYSDIVYTPNVIEQLIHSDGEIILASDSQWQRRFEGRTDSYLQEAEKIYLDDGIVSISKTGDYNSSVGEFAGLMIIRKTVVSKLLNIIEEAFKSSKESIIDIVELLSKESDVRTVDIKGNWAELDSSQDLIQFKFGTKAETLKSLENKLSLSKVLSQYSFTVADYNKDKYKVITDIQSSFTSKSLVVRSSALNEDTANSSMAGNYESVLNIDRSSEIELERAINFVINSYLKGNQEQNISNQILVQSMLENVTMSGVLFTKDLETSAPYYTINYDLSGSTESITAGSKGEHKTLVFYKFSETLPFDSNEKLLIEAVRELESFVGFNSLDIEFAIADDELFILQVRPIAAHKDALKVFNNDITMELDAIKSYINVDGNKKNKLVGDRTAFGVMPDWNPAEIIGINPKPLAFSLYQEIITDRIWSMSRVECGYRDTISHPGIISFSGKPYVDVRMSFNSFTPKQISDKLAHKLINYYIDKLNKHPEYHDKVEFEVAITAYDLDIDSRIKELKEEGFSSTEIQEIKKSFLELTNNIILEKNISIVGELDKTRSLKDVRDEVRISDIDPLNKAVILLETVKERGTLPFSNLARFGFIGAILLKSLLKLKIISDTDYNNFFQSVKTVAKDFLYDINSMGKDELQLKYGHLRPGTYEISSPAYHENFDSYINLTSQPIKEEVVDFKLSDEQTKSIDDILGEHNLNFSSETLFNFIRKATEARELAKFDFSKNLSLALDYIEEFCESIGISRNDASFLKIDDIYTATYGSISSNIKNEWLALIEYRKAKHLVTSAIKLPELILSNKDLDFFYQAMSKPNFVTYQQVTGEIVQIVDNNTNIIDKIVCIENADPGFDWIFSHNIKGLITKYGGTNSHMAIRCAEFDLPAAIGCGDSIYDNISDKSSVYLDCLGKKIEVLQ